MVWGLNLVHIWGSEREVWGLNLLWRLNLVNLVSPFHSISPEGGVCESI